jgi:hypothetical protein
VSASTRKAAHVGQVIVEFNCHLAACPASLDSGDVDVNNRLVDVIGAACSGQKFQQLLRAWLTAKRH